MTYPNKTGNFILSNPKPRKTSRLITGPIQGGMQCVSLGRIFQICFQDVFQVVQEKGLHFRTMIPDAV
jgi:hypothetical protein